MVLGVFMEKQMIKSNAFQILSFTQNFLKVAVILLSWFYTWSQMLLLNINLK